MSSESSWFYEGFALIAAGQFEKTAPLLNATEIGDIVSAQERGDYRQYAAAFRYFLGKTSIQQLIEIADKPEFFGGQGTQASVVFDETGGRAPRWLPQCDQPDLTFLGRILFRPGG